MRKPRSLVPIPRHLAVEIDRIAGHRHRAAFVTELLEREIRRREQLDALEAATGSWQDQDHPELHDGGDKWVREMRRQSIKRLEGTEQGTEPNR